MLSKKPLVSRLSLPAPLAAAVVLCAYAAVNAQNWQLVWSDEFNGTSLDTTKWSFILTEGDPGVAAYTNRDTNCFIENGHLVIQALKENYGGKQYTSTQIGTKKKGDWLYCKMDIRAKLPYGKGLWPALWLLPTDNFYNGWPRSGEIDIMENLGNNTKLFYTTIHYGANNESSQGTYTLPGTSSLADSFHVYTMIWDSTSFKFYLDNNLYYTLNHWTPDNVPYPEPFDKRFYLLFDVAIGGGWAGNPDSTTVFPQRMEVDYVHVYQNQGTGVVARDRGSRLSAGDATLRVEGTSVQYELKSGEVARMTLSDMLGREIAVLVDKWQPCGVYRIDIPHALLGHGVLLCTLRHGAVAQTREITARP